MQTVTWHECYYSSLLEYLDSEFQRALYFDQFGFRILVSSLL